MKQQKSRPRKQSAVTDKNETPVQTDLSVQSAEARNIVYKYSAIASGVGLIPVPVFDLVALSALQLKMVADLSKHYQIKFEKNAGKMIVASLLGAIVPEALSRGTFVSVLKMTPLIGPVIGGVTMLAFTGASTYAIGMVFMSHFQAGGTLIDFEVAKARENFNEMYAKGLELVKSRWAKTQPGVQEEVVDEPVTADVTNN
ncbi:DUF697 domain-containing protein [candidate division KSB1 bacterium]|nr:DUF697 domain-containing protein [candidate division KSB1 bacterium]